MWAAAWGIRARQKEPYHRNDLDEALRWLDRLRGRALSQRDLVEAWSQHAAPRPEARPSALTRGEGKIVAYLGAAEARPMVDPGRTELAPIP